MKQGKQRIKCFKYEENERHREKGETILERVARESLYKEVTFRVRMGRSSPQKIGTGVGGLTPGRKGEKALMWEFKFWDLRGSSYMPLGNETKQNKRPKNYMLPTNKRIRLNNNCKGWKSFFLSKRASTRRKTRLSSPNSQALTDGCVRVISTLEGGQFATPAWMMGLESWRWLATTGGLLRRTLHWELWFRWVYPCPIFPSLFPENFHHEKHRKTFRISEFSQNYFSWNRQKSYSIR